MAAAKPSFRIVTILLLGLSAGRASALTVLQPEPDDDAIRRLLVRYEEAIETQDLEEFRAVMPGLSDDEVGRLSRSFQSIESHAVEITIVSIDVEAPRGRVVLRRRDVLNAGTAAEVATAFSQVLTLAKEAGAWHIERIER